MASASLTSKGQVTIPKEIRDKLKVGTGDRLDFVIEGDEVTLRPAIRDLRSLRGVLHRPDRPPVAVEEMDAAIARFHRRKR